jgi:hypothetical protein
MNLYQFKLLSSQAQAVIIETKGNYLTTIEISEYTIDLYRVENFYVKVFYSKTSDEITLRSYYSVDAYNIFGDEGSDKYFNETLSRITYLY